MLGPMLLLSSVQTAYPTFFQEETTIDGGMMPD